MSDFSPDHPSCTQEEAPLCKNFKVKCWHCSLNGSMFWSPVDGKTRHHSFWERQKEKRDAKRAEGLGKMGGRGNKTKSLKKVLADKAEKRVKKTLNRKFSNDRMEELFEETLSSGRIRGDGDLKTYCAILDVKSTTRRSSWSTENSDLVKAQAQARNHGKPYGIIVNENAEHEAIACMSLEDLTHLFQYVSYLEKALKEERSS